MKKLNAKGFAHQVLIMAVVVVAVIGSVGSYVYLRNSSASTITGGGGGSTITINPADWYLYSTAKITTDGGTNKVVRLMATAEGQAGTAYIGIPWRSTKFKNFISANWGKNLTVCIRARGLNYSNSITVEAKAIFASKARYDYIRYFTTSYSTTCSTYRMSSASLFKSYLPTAYEGGIDIYNDINPAHALNIDWMKLTAY